MFNPTELIDQAVDALADQILAVRRLAAAAQSVAVALSPFDAEHNPCPAVSPNSLVVCVYQTTVPQIVEMRRALAAEGLRLDVDNEKPVRDEPSMNLQEHRLRTSDDSLVRILFILKTGAGKTCSYVQTGTKTVEQPIYELRCSDASDPRTAETVNMTVAEADALTGDA